jgi:hypothetical protein
MDKKEVKKFKLKLIMLVTAFLIAFFIALAMTVNFAKSVVENENVIYQTKIELVAEELDLKIKEVVKDNDAIDTYYTNKGKYKVNFDTSNDDIKLRSIVKVKE